LDAVVQSLMEGQAGKVLNLIGEVAGQGKDLRVFARDLNARLRGEMLERLAHSRDGEGIDKLGRVIGRLAAADQEMRWSTQPRILLEVAMVRAARTMTGGGSGSTEDRMGEMAARIRELEGLVAGLAANQGGSARDGGNRQPGSAAAPREVSAGPAQAKSSAPGRKAENSGYGISGSNKSEISDPGVQYNEMVKKTKTSPTAKAAEGPPGPGGAAEKNTAPVPDVVLRKVDARWNDLLETARKVYPNIATHLTQGKGWPLEVDGKTLTIAFPKSGSYTPLALGILQGETNIRELSDLIKSVCKEELRVRLVESDRKPPAGTGRKKTAVGPDDVEALFGKAEDLPEEDFEGFDR
jgi:DNA polymerase-3 subunit gamma/tau